MPPNSVAFFEDSRLHLNGIYFNSIQKILALTGFEPLPVEAKISKVHALPSELAGPGGVADLFWNEIIRSKPNSLKLNLQNVHRAMPEN